MAHAGTWHCVSAVSSQATHLQDMEVPMSSLALKGGFAPPERLSRPYEPTTCRENLDDPSESLIGSLDAETVSKVPLHLRASST